MPRALREAPPRARRMDHHQTRRRILDAARRLMGERGPESLTVSSVARAAELNRTTAYQHFRTRDELVGAVMAELVEEVGERIGAAQPLDARIDDLVAPTSSSTRRSRGSRSIICSARAPSRARPGGRTSTSCARSPKGRQHAGRRRSRDARACADGASPCSGRCTRAPSTRARPPCAPRPQRFARELKRLLLYGVLRPERCPELVASLAPDRREEEDMSTLRFDPFSSELRANPYPAYAELRRHAPVYRVESSGIYTVSRYADVLFVLRHPELFSSSAMIAVLAGAVAGAAPAAGMGLRGAEAARFSSWRRTFRPRPLEMLASRSLIGADPPVHGPMRNLVNRGFTPRRIAALEPRIREIARSALDALDGERRARSGRGLLRAAAGDGDLPSCSASSPSAAPTSSTGRTP